MQFAPTTYYIVDVTTADKQELMAALKDVPGITSVEDGGMYWVDIMYSQVHIEALDAVWSLEQLDELLYSLNYDVVGIVEQESTMKRNYNGVSKGKVIPLTEVKPGMVFRIVSDRAQPVVAWLFWCNADGGFCTNTDAVTQVPEHGRDGHDHWLDTAGWNKALVINSFDKRAI